MSKVKYTPVTDEELDRIKQETLERDKVEPRVDVAYYETDSGHLVLEMRGGAIVRVPARSLKALSQATDEQMQGIRVVSNGSAVFWDSLDVQMTTIALLQLIFNLRTLEETVKKAGRARSVAKAAAARANGAKGGRPRKVAP